MHAKMKVEKMSRKLIKPETPTPEKLKKYYISLLDTYMVKMNVGVILFYQSKLKSEDELEESLAKILVQFYPLAGRYLKNDHMIDCSDEGVELVVAKAVDELMDVIAIAKADAEQLNHLLPDQYFRADDAPHDPLLSIQATHFPCGGLAIAISVSHRVFDAASLDAFIAAWSNATNPDHTSTTRITPSFDLHSLLPYRDHYFGEFPEQDAIASDFVVKRLVFDKDALARLRSRFNGKTSVSRVRVVCAVIAKALIGVYRAQNGGVIDVDFVIAQLVNMRERTVLPQPKHACGNLVIPAVTGRVTAAEAEAIGVEELVEAIGDSVRKSIAEYAQILSPNTDGCQIIINIFTSFLMQVLKPHTNLLGFTDWSKCGGFYEADFGFGKPVWVSSAPQRPDSNTTVLMSDKDGHGIEAWVHLRPNDMRYFLQDEEIKLFLTS